MRMALICLLSIITFCATNAVSAELARRFVPNELIVGYNSEADQKAALEEFQNPKNAERSGLGSGISAVGVGGSTIKLHINMPRSADDGKPGSELKRLESYAKSMKRDGRVKYAHPNWIVTINPIELNEMRPPAELGKLAGAAKTRSANGGNSVNPDDPLYTMGLQWNYLPTPVGMNAVGAWKVLSKAPHHNGKRVIVAILDTGIVNDQPDIANAGHLLNGYNFVSYDTCEWRDVERTTDASDTGNHCGPNGGSSGWHGTHVAGIIGAAGTNNSEGIASIAGTENVGILPVRVLGSGSGTMKDIADAIRWAAGLPVEGVVDNKFPADIINMSLGGPIVLNDGTLGTCDENNFGELISAIADARNAGTVIVVSAGNAEYMTSDNQDCTPTGEDDKTCQMRTFDVRNYQPSGCPGVISVAASNPKGGIAFYSNHGDVSIMAPGGDVNMTYDFPRDGDKPLTLALGVWSTIKSEKDDTLPYGPMMGTSQAAPHVAGAIALALVKHPEWRGKPDVIEAKLRATAAKVGPNACPDPTPCGPGQLDAGALLSAR